MTNDADFTQNPKQTQLQPLVVLRGRPSACRTAKMLRARGRGVVAIRCDAVQSVNSAMSIRRLQRGLFVMALDQKTVAMKTARITSQMNKGTVQSGTMKQVTILEPARSIDIFQGVVSKICSVVTQKHGSANEWVDVFGRPQWSGALGTGCIKARAVAHRCCPPQVSHAGRIAASGLTRVY